VKELGSNWTRALTLEDYIAKLGNLPTNGKNASRKTVGIPALLVNSKDSFSRRFMYDKNCLEILVNTMWDLCLSVVFLLDQCFYFEKT